MKKLKSKKVYLVLLIILLTISLKERVNPRGELQVRISLSSYSTIEKSYEKKLTYHEKNNFWNHTPSNFAVNLFPVGAQVKVGR